MLHTGARGRATFTSPYTYDRLPDFTTAHIYNDSTADSW
jgi:hypothetical protein